MSIVPVYQSPNDLALAVVHDPGVLDVTLTILREQVVQVGAWSFAFHIIGESHVVTVRHNDTPVLSEVLACVQVEQAVCQHHHQFRDLRDHCHSRAGYQVEVTFDDEVGANFGADSIEVEFPTIYGQTPVTRIEWQHDAGVVSWRTLHVYPGAACVHSISHFDTANYNQAI